MELKIVTPERELAALEITSVQIPGMMGDLTVMPNHAPFLTTLRPGVLTVESTDGRQEFVVTGGFAEISPDAASVLAEKAAPKAEAPREMLEAVLKDAQAALETVDEAGKAAAALRVNDLTQLIAREG